MIFTHLALYSFFDGAGSGIVTTGGLPVLTLYHYFDGFTPSGDTATTGVYIPTYRPRRR